MLPAKAEADRRSHADFLRREVILPLGMIRASVHVPPELRPLAATRYGSDGLPYPHYDFDHPGGSAAHCSAHDLARCAMFHLQAHHADQRAILSDETITGMQEATAVIDGTRRYAFGWQIDDDL